MATCKGTYRGHTVALMVEFVNDTTLSVDMINQSLGQGLYAPDTTWYYGKGNLTDHLMQLTKDDSRCKGKSRTTLHYTKGLRGACREVSYYNEDMCQAIVDAIAEFYN